MTKCSGGKFRKKRTNFSMVSNEILHDSSISLKAKGLYSVIQSFITLEDFVLYKGYLQSICIEGERAFDSAWKELKERGYLIQHKMRKGARTFYYEYELLDFPLPAQNVGVENVDKHLVNGTKEGGINNNILNNTLNNNTIPNHIISEHEVMEQIGYNPQMKDDFVENIILIMVEVLNMSDNAVVKINQVDTSAKLVKERFKKIQYKHIQYIKLVFQDFAGEITSLKSYMITTLYNAPATCDIYFANRVNRDLYKETVSSI